MNEFQIRYFFTNGDSLDAGVLAAEDIAAAERQLMYALGVDAAAVEAKHPNDAARAARPTIIVRAPDGEHIVFKRELRSVRVSDPSKHAETSPDTTP